MIEVGNLQDNRCDVDEFSEADVILSMETNVFRCVGYWTVQEGCSGFHVIYAWIGFKLTASRQLNLLILFFFGDDKGLSKMQVIQTFLDNNFSGK